MVDFNLKQIGKFEVSEGRFLIKVFSEYAEAMKGLEDFSYLQVIWWFDKCDSERSRGKLVEEKPYKKGPEALGAFATRTPERPNPIALSTVYVLSADIENGLIELPYADAADGTPVLDIKPYIPSIDRVKDPIMPKWCKHWPSCVEESGEFDWASEFNF